MSEAISGYPAIEIDDVAYVVDTVNARHDLADYDGKLAFVSTDEWNRLVEEHQPEPVVSDEMADLPQHERKLAQVAADRDRRIRELEDERQAYEIKHPGQEWNDAIKLNELGHLKELYPAE